MTVQQLQLTPENVKTVAGRAHVHAVMAAPGDKSLRDDFETWIAVALVQNELAHGGFAGSQAELSELLKRSMECRSQTQINREIGDAKIYGWIAGEILRSQLAGTELEDVNILLRDLATDLGQLTSLI